MLQEIPEEENGFTNRLNGKTYDEFKAWLIRSDNISNGIGLEDWMVPQTTYWLYVDGLPVGMGKLRHYLNDKLLIEGGSVGYAIRPSQRNMGYGKILLNMFVNSARDMNMDRILLTIRNSNAASIKVALSNNGKIEKVDDHRHYIWIDCKK